jgi:hypothetical protein
VDAPPAVGYVRAVRQKGTATEVPAGLSADAFPLAADDPRRTTGPLRASPSRSKGSRTIWQNPGGSNSVGGAPVHRLQTVAHPAHSWEKFTPPVGFEPTTPRSVDRCSIQLSYGGSAPRLTKLHQHKDASGASQPRWGDKPGSGTNGCSKNVRSRPAGPRTAPQDPAYDR